MLSDEERKEIDAELAILPTRQAACIEALKAVQRHRRWVSDDGVRDIAGYLEMTPAEVDNVATFYNLIFRKPVGRHVILVCDSVSCWIMGCERLQGALEKHLGIRYGQTTRDDRFTLLPMECLGACDRAPALMVDDELHGDVEDTALEPILERYE